jgi:hypothetical protein
MPRAARPLCGFTPAALVETDPEVAAALDEEMGLSSVADAQAGAAARKGIQGGQAFELPPP